MVSLKKYNVISSRPAHRAHSGGISLLELSIGMMILAVLSVGVSSLVKAGVESQMSERVHQNMQIVGMNIVDDLRYDIRTAEAVAVSNGGNTLSLTMDSSTNITYSLSGGTMRRVATNQATKIYNDPSIYSNLMQVSCPSGCFELAAPDPTKSANQVKIAELRVEKTLRSGTSGTIIDQHFGTANFSIRDFAFDVVSATEFR